MHVIVLHDRAKINKEKRDEGHGIDRRTYGKMKIVWTEETFWAYFKGGGPVQFGSVYCVRWDICDV